MLRTWREEYRANQALRREIKVEEWEQKKRWREEDRAERKKVIEENAAVLAAHNDYIKAATGVSYLTLVCHEDTWAFMAARAFGLWDPAWTQSTIEFSPVLHAPDWEKGQRFTVDPNLPEGRIRKIRDGSELTGNQEVLLSGHNLTLLLNALHDGVTEDDVVTSARCSRLYNKLAGFVELLDPDAEGGQTTGVRYYIDDSVDGAHVSQ